MSSVSLPILTELPNKLAFHSALTSNPGVIIIKFGAEWCRPCKKIEEHVKILMNSMPENVQSYIVDIDESLEVYSFLKTKKMVKAIPSILAYYKNDEATYIPDDIVIGADVIAINEFFERSYIKATE
jgi:thiol-disulfide isomerase/thioredoxin